MTLSLLAARTSFEVVILVGIEDGNVDVRLLQVVALSEALQCSVSDLLVGAPATHEDLA